jgi:uncharacterized protein YbjQ (UPF0145 family)
MKLECPGCRVLVDDAESECWKCGSPIPVALKASVAREAEARERQALAAESARLTDLVAKAHETGDWSAVPEAIVANLAGEIVLTTSFLLAGREIEREIEIVTAECVFGMNIFRDLFAAARDLFGGRSVATQKVLRDARRTALRELRKEALMVGADAVIVVDLDWQEISGGSGGGMIMLVASGTAVQTRAAARPGVPPAIS